MKWHRSVVAVLGLTLVSSTSLFAQQPPPVPSAPSPAARAFDIAGTVRYEADYSHAGMIKIELRTFSGQLVQMGFTRSNGEFHFGGVPVGSYVLTVEEKGYQPVRESIEVVTNSHFGVQIYLRKEEEVPRQQESGMAVSARELSMPRKARDAYRRGLELFYAKLNAQASVEQFQRALKEAPTFYEAHYEMGMAYVSMSKYEEAEKSFRKALELSERAYAAPYFGLAGMYVNMNKMAEAEATARQGLILDGEAWQGHYELGRALLALGRVAEAETTIQAAKNHNPGFPSVHLLMANVHIRQKNYAALIADLDEFLRLEPKGPMSDRARAMRGEVERSLAQAKGQPPPGPPQ